MSTVESSRMPAEAPDSPRLVHSHASLAAPRANRRIRVLIVAARFLPDLGGTETHVYEVTRRMARRNDLDLTVLTTDRLGIYPVREELEGFTVLRCRAYPRRRDYYFAPEIYRHVLSGNYDLVHCQGIHTAVPVLAMIAARRQNIPYVVTLHTGGHSSGLRRRLRATQWRALGSLLRDAAVIIAVSRYEQQTFQRTCSLDSNCFKIIRNAGGFSADSDSDRSETIPGRIVSSGRLERYKGHHRIIEALPIVQRSIPCATLHILGSGPYEGRLRSLIRTLGLEKSVVIEYISPDDRKRMAMSLSSAAVVAALSQYESNPVSVMEALALGVRTIGLNTAGIGDLVEEGLVIGVAKDATSASIAETLIRVLQGGQTNDLPSLPTWDVVATDLAGVYLAAVRAGPRSVRHGSVYKASIAAEIQKCVRMQ